MKMSRNKFLALLLLSLAALACANHAYAEVLFVPTDRMRTEIYDGKRTQPVVVQPPAWRAPRPSDLPFRVTNSRVDVRVEENVATTTIEQSFLNLSAGDLEVRVLIPLPKDATIYKSALSMNDEMVEGKLYAAAEAQQIYESIVRSRRDPALLRFAGENLYEARVFPIPPNQERRLKFSYDTVLVPVNGVYDFRHILAGSQLYRGGVEKFQCECVIRSKSSLGPIYSPSHKVHIERPDAKTAVVKLSDTNLSTDQDFRLYYATSTEDVALRVITHRGAEGEDGYFMVLGRPNDQLAKTKVLAKEIVFVLDTSGSMVGEKIEQARKALTFCLNQLNPQDRFNLVTFATTVSALSKDTLLDATQENVKRALDAVEALEATGGTAIDDALRSALANNFSSGPEKAKLVIFLTDGLPSVGVTDAATILKDVHDGNKTGVRVFNFGVGTDVNTHLLDRIANEHDGTSAYVAPKEDLELKLSDFYAKIKNPVMTNVTFTFEGVGRTHSMYPKRVPAIFKGSELLLFGRYKGAGPGKVTLKGNIGGEERTIAVDLIWPEREKDSAFLPRIWAMRKIGHLLEELRLNGNNQETIDEVVKLSQLHGIVTPYTSQLVLEPGMNPQDWHRRGSMPARTTNAAEWGGGAGGSGGGSSGFGGFGDRDGARILAQAEIGDHFENLSRAAREETKKVAEKAQQAQSGRMAVGLAETEKQLKDAEGLAEDKPKAPGAKPAEDAKGKNEAEARKLRNQAYAATFNSKADAQETGEAVNALAEAKEALIKHAGGRTFYRHAGTWIDSAFKAGKETKPVEVQAFSKEYFELLKKHTDLGAVLALGGRILVMVEETAFQIVPAEQK